MKIACLHTLDANAALFDAACPPGVELIHGVREDLLQRALAAGEADEGIIEETAAALRALAEESGADGVLLTCTTIAAGAERAGAVRVDAALAEEAARAAGEGGLIDVLITVPTTEAPTRAIFERFALPAGARLTITFIEGALAAFQARDLDTYAHIIAAAIDRSTADIVALAQASMAPAAALASRPALTSPSAGLSAAVAATGAVPPMR
ncbi:Asp/Glu racemase [Pikeienuella piscinae]|uniref:Asp/Glu racemase n=1 Tax=Pikeienuella piscinae TaxID=2748098 RepID=A0A7L5BY76_9RHOB|nr:Asp/Glu racemase [Pikeienuella piscinae]QIE56401.1 Asp/Glu racemase [Pikeienuella piscinae]